MAIKKITLNELRNIIKESINENIDKLKIIVNFKKSTIEFYDSIENDFLTSFAFEPLENRKIDTDKQDIVEYLKRYYNFRPYLTVTINGIDYSGNEIRYGGGEDYIHSPRDVISFLEDFISEYEAMMASGGF